MAGSNKVVLLQTSSFVTPTSPVKVFDNRKQLTAWLSENADMKKDGDDGKKNKIDDDDGGVLLREAVDLSFQEGTPLRYNSKYLVAKWLSGTVEEGNVIVRAVLRYSGPWSSLEIDTFAPTEVLSKATMADTFKVKQDKLKRARIVSSLEPSGPAAKAGFLVGDVLLKHGSSSKNKTDLFLASEKKSFIMDFSSLTSSKGLVFAARAIPPNKTKCGPTPKAPEGYREPPTDLEVTDVEDNDSEKINTSTVTTKKKATKKTKKRTTSKGETTNTNKVTKKKVETTMSIHDSKAATGVEDPDTMLPLPEDLLAAVLSNGTEVYGANKNAKKYLEEATMKNSKVDLTLAKGAIPNLLKILSDDKYEGLHLLSVKLIENMANHSASLATCLLSNFAVDCLLVSQVVHGMGVREVALQAIGKIAKHSKQHCLEVLKVHDCLVEVLSSYKHGDLMFAASCATLQFCIHAPEGVLSQELIDAIGEGISTYDDVTSNVSAESLVFLVKGITKKQASKFSLKKTMQNLIWKIDRKSSVLKLQQLLMLCSKSFVVETILSCHHIFDTLSHKLRSTDRELQVLACNALVLLLKYMNKNSKKDVHHRYKELDKRSLFSPIVKLMRYCGPAKSPATKTCIEMIQYDAVSLAKLIEKSGCIGILCNALGECKETGQNGLMASGIMMAFQSITDNSFAFEQDIVVEVGLAVAKAMGAESE